MHQHNNPKGSSAIGLTRQSSHAGHAARTGTDFATHTHTHTHTHRKLPPGIVLAGCGIAAMTIGLLLAEPWTPVSESRATTIAAASPAVVTTSSTSSPAVAAASNLTKAARTLPASAQSSTWVGPPAQYYAVIDLGPLGDFIPGGDVDAPNPDMHGTMGINNLGEVVYARNVSDTIRAFVWLPNDNYGLDCYNPHHGADAWGRFDLNDLARQDAGRFSIARDINDAGMVAGQIGDDHVNGEIGDIVANLDAGSSKGVVWMLDEPGTGGAEIDHEDLPLFSGGAWVAPHAINNDATPTIVGAGDLLGECTCPEFEPPEESQFGRPFSWVLGDGSLTQLDRSDVGTTDQFLASMGAAHDVNITLDPGPSQLDPKAVGGSFCTYLAGNPESLCEQTEPACGGTFRANGWDLGQPSLIVLDGIPPAGGQTELREGAARGVNDLGNVVGFGADYVGQFGTNCPRRALLWLAVEAMENPIVIGDEMPSQQGGQQSRAEAINNSCRNHIVGWNETAQRAVRWTRTEDGNFNDWDAVDLNEAIRYCDDEWRIVEAHDINDEGWIAAWGFPIVSGNPDLDDPRALVLIPVPHHPGDLNGDGVVDVLDLLIVIAEWGTKCDTLDCPEFCDGDGNGDGKVDVHDLLLVISNWSATLDPCDFEPDIDCYTHPGGGGTGSGPTAAPFGDLLDAWEFDDWDDVEQWMETADPQDIQDFLDDLEDAANQL